MKKITKEQDGSYHWSCSIDIDYHRRSARNGLLGVLLICAVVFFAFLIAAHGKNTQNDLWIPLLVTGVILVISLPLLFLWYTASDPHEQYVMTGEYIKSGYSRGSVFTDFRKTKSLTVASKYLELTDGHRSNRIYVPAEDMEFVREFILERLPDDAAVRYL